MAERTTDRTPAALEELLEATSQYDPEADQDRLRRAYEFAASAHEGQKRLTGDDYVVHPLAVAKLLKKVIEEEQPGLVILGKQAIDDDCNQTGQMLSALLGWSQAAFASKVEISGDSATVTREIDGGLQTIKCKMPMIVTTDLRLNQPRYASLPNIMKAKKKPLDEKVAADMGVELAPKLKVVSTTEPPARQGGKKVGSVAELVDKLKNEAGVI